MKKNSRIYIADHQELVGGAIRRYLEFEGYENLIYRSEAELNLKDQQAVLSFFEKEKPEFVFLAAQKAGGILADSSRKAEFLYDNMMRCTHVIHAAHAHKVEKLLFVGSSSVYPKMAPQPLKEEYLLSGWVNDAAIASICGIKLCEAYRNQYGNTFISAVSSKVYGIGDNFDLRESHVIPALIRKFHEARMNGQERVEVWGTGSAYRGFLFSDDLAEACVFLMEQYSGRELINIGSGKEINMLELALMVKDITGFEGYLKFDTTKPDGMPRKILDVGKIEALGWTHKTDLVEGIQLVYHDFITSRNIA